MQKRHFEALARALFESRPVGGELPVAMRPRVVQWVEDVERIADVCAAHNDRFRRESFYDACGYTKEHGRES